MNLILKHLQLILIRLSFIFLFISIGSITHAEESTTPKQLVVAIDFQYAPFSVLTPSGEPAGLFIDIWNRWSAETGISVKYIPANWEETISALKDGRAQIHAGLFRSEQRALYMDFSEPTYSIKTGLFFKSGEDYLVSINSISGKTVGVINSSFQQDYMLKKYPSIIIRSYSDSSTMIQGLLNNEVDAIFDEIPNVNQILIKNGWQGIVKRDPEIILSNTVHAGVLKENSQLLKIIEDGFHSIPSSDLAEIESRWITESSNRYYKSNSELEVFLTSDEQKYIRNKEFITLASTPDWPPFEMQNADGGYNGIAADFIRLAANKVGLQIQPVFDKWSTLDSMLKKGELDVAPGLNQNENRDQYLTFTSPYIEYYSAIYVKNDRDDIKTLEDLKGKTVALENGWAVSRGLAKSNPEIKQLLVDTSFDAIKSVSIGDADAYIGNQVVASYLIKKFTFVNLQSKSLYNEDLPGRLRFAVSNKDKQLRNILQKGLDNISNDEREAILSSYIDMNAGFRDKIFSLTESQWDWLKKLDTFTIGIDPSWAPFEFADDKGDYKGISSEYINFISDKLKITTNPVTGLSRSEILKRSDDGLLDILPCIAKTAELEKSLLFSDPYLSFPIVIFTRKDNPVISGVKDLHDKTKIGVIEGYTAYEFLKRDMPGLNLVTFNNLEEAMSSLSSGNINYLVNDLVSGAYTIDSMALTNIKVSASTKYQLELSVAVRKDLPELIPIINKVLNIITPEEANEMESKWLSIRFEHGMDIWTVLKWVFPISTILLIILGVIILWNRRMNEEIKSRKLAESKLAATFSSLDEKNSMLEGLSSKLSKYLAPQVYESIFSGTREVDLKSERKKLTIFFSDIKDFTQTTDDMQPEDLTELLKYYFTEMSHIALKYGATIDKFIGDAMLMFFGDPSTLGVEEDARQAVLMAVEMQRRMAELEVEWHNMGFEKPFKMRIGINTGFCNVGNFGSEDRMDYTIIGGEVNLAARLEAKADPGGVLMAYETYALVKDHIRAEERALINMKGIRREVRPYAVLGIHDQKDTQSDVIRYKYEGLTLKLDKNKLSEKDLDQTIVVLNKALEVLKENKE